MIVQVLTSELRRAAASARAIDAKTLTLVFGTSGVRALAYGEDRWTLACGASRGAIGHLTFRANCERCQSRVTEAHMTLTLSDDPCDEHAIALRPQDLKKALSGKQPSVSEITLTPGAGLVRINGNPIQAANPHTPKPPAATQTPTPDPAPTPPAYTARTDASALAFEIADRVASGRVHVARATSDAPGTSEPWPQGIATHWRTWAQPAADDQHVGRPWADCTTDCELIDAHRAGIDRVWAHACATLALPDVIDLTGAPFSSVGGTLLAREWIAALTRAIERSPRGVTILVDHAPDQLERILPYRAGPRESLRVGL